MTDPPMQWAYPRTVDGFIHALTRGQYEPIHPTSGTGTTYSANHRQFSCDIWIATLALPRRNSHSNLTFSYLLLALVIFLVYRKLKRRERVWIIGLVAIYIFIGPFLVLLLNFSPDRQSMESTPPLFTASHVFIAMFVGYGLTMIASFMATQYEADA